MRTPFALVVALLLAASPARAGTPCILDADCSDGNFCNGVERCVGGMCQAAAALQCDDADPCTRDFCDPAAGCAHAEDQCPASCAGLADGASCADGTVCTRGDTCVSAACVAGAVASCDDGDPCTRDGCDPVLGCVYSEEAVAFPCVPDCNGGVADYTPCPGDGNVCTLDACLPSVDLIGDPHRCVVGLLGLERQCQDADVCNGQEFCSPVLGCQSGPPLVCDDGASCNGVESCDPVLGCQSGTPEPDGTACDDARQCTTGDACVGGACVGAPLPPAACDDADPGTTDVCEEGFECLHCAPSALGRLALHVGAPGKDTLRARGELPDGSATTIAPGAERVALLVEDGATGVFRAALAPGALLANPAGTRFAYRDPSGAAGAVRVLRVQVRGPTVKWSVLAGDLSLSAVPPAGVTVRLVIGAACFSSTAGCVAGGRRVICR